MRSGKVVVDSEGIKAFCKEYVEKVLNKENTKGSECVIAKEVIRALRR